MENCSWIRSPCPDIQGSSSWRQSLHRRIQLLQGKRSQTWESVTICQVAGEIASRYGLECVYDADEITIKRMEQNKRPDSEFLKELCSRYGLILKIYNRRLIVFSYENYEKGSRRESSRRRLRGFHGRIKVRFTGPIPEPGSAIRP